MCIRASEETCLHARMPHYPCIAETTCIPAIPLEEITMTFMPWSSALMLGIPYIDAHHQTLVGLINTLHDEVDNPIPDRAVIGQVLEGLVDYTHNHFIEEEVLFQRHGYPQTQEHIAEHAQFTAQAMNWLLRFEAGEEVDVEAMEFLKNWLLHHILEEDRAYVPFFQNILGSNAPEDSSALPADN